MYIIVERPCAPLSILISRRHLNQGMALNLFYGQVSAWRNDIIGRKYINGAQREIGATRYQMRSRCCSIMANKGVAKDKGIWRQIGIGTRRIVKRREVAVAIWRPPRK